MTTITIKSSGPEAGTYQAVFAGTEERESQKDGNSYLRWSFKAQTTSGEMLVSGTSSINSGPKAKSYKWLTGLLGRKPGAGERLVMDDLVGRECLVVLEENEDGFANVVEVLPPSKSKTPREPEIDLSADLDDLRY